MPLSIEEFGEKWELVEAVYDELTDGRNNLSSSIRLQKRTRGQSFDMWCSEFGGFAIEFDESQHFNQFRRRTLDFYESIPISFDLNLYKTLSSRNVKPGLSGFSKLKSSDPLFPELLKGEKQDNRTRQRAFRDFLKDLTPICKGFQPTIRIPYSTTNKNIKDFTVQDIQGVVEYLKQINFKTPL